MPQERDHYIDLIRGICVLGIIFIHTCFHSGESYVPLWMASLSLLLDVPAFFFISGMTMVYVKNKLIINSLFRLSLVFTLLSILLNVMFSRLSLSAIMQPLFLSEIPVSNYFYSVRWSYLFVPVFACTIILSSILIKKFENLIAPIIILLLMVYFLVYIGIISIKSYQFLGRSIEQVLFPTACCLFGYWCQNNIVNTTYRKKFACSLFITVCLAFLLCLLAKGSIVFDLQSNKFPFSFPYIIASFLSMAVFIYFYNANLRNIFIEHIGQNAIFYYAGQGVSSSILFSLSPHITLYWGLKLAVMFISNVIMAVIISEVLRIIYILIGKLFMKSLAR